MYINYILITYYHITKYFLIRYVTIILDIQGNELKSTGHLLLTNNDKDYGYKVINKNDYNAIIALNPFFKTSVKDFIKVRQDSSEVNSKRKYLECYPGMV